MAMDGDVMAQEVLNLIGGEMTPERLRAFQKFCEGIVQHIQKHAQVTVTGVYLGSGQAPGKIQ